MKRGDDQIGTGDWDDGWGDNWIAPPLAARKGRGAVSNLAGRYEVQTTEAVDDGWWHDEDDNGQPVQTFVTREYAKSILSRNTSPDLPFSVSLNPYRGCEHGCIYCFARPTHAYLGLSPGLDFETRLYAKHRAPELLRAALAKPGYKPATIALGANTDPYQPIERKLGITRRLLEVFSETRHPVCIITKSALVLRDLDILEE